MHVDIEIRPRLQKQKVDEVENIEHCRRPHLFNQFRSRRLKFQRKNDSCRLCNSKILDKNQEVTNLVVAFVDLGVDKALITKACASRLGWKGTEIVSDGLMRRLLENPVRRMDGLPIEFLGIHTISVIVEEFGQEWCWDLQVVPDREMQPTEVVLDKTLAIKYGLY